MLLLSISISSILISLLYLCLVVAAVYIVYWILGLLGLVIPENIKRVILAIIIILCLIWVVNNFFTGGFDINPRR